MNQSRFNLPVPYGWYAVSLSNQLAVGEVKPLYYFEKDLVLFCDKPVLCDGDGPITLYRKWFSQFYVAEQNPGVEQ